MPRLIEENPNLPQITQDTMPAVRYWASVLVRELLRINQSIAYRLNRSISQDGEVAMDAPLGLKSYEAADLPDAADWEGHVVYVSDAAPGSKFKGSDGTAWVDLG